MTDRLEKIFALIPECDTFADIGCDHGYIANAMLKSSKAKKVIIADISAKCLEKAEQLLEENIKDGSAISVVSNGFDKVPSCDTALIAGMGGEEICDIISMAKTLPNTLILQPMKNCDKVRLCAVKSGYCIKKDFMFKSAGKFYDLMLLHKGKDSLTDEEIEFGRDNLDGQNQDFKEFLKIKISRLETYLKSKNLSIEDRKSMLLLKEKFEKYV
ncbi:MAG: SAM-dependent methyltransferase [Clostridia bacterium]|nr:SAM-dependent methyltransferase [Clostridia bacterium]